MTVRELINKLLDSPMDEEVMLCYNKEHIDERGEKCSRYAFHIDDVEEGEIIFTDWRDERESAEKIWKKAVDEFDKNFLSVGRD